MIKKTFREINKEVRTQNINSLRKSLFSSRILQEMFETKSKKKRVNILVLINLFYMTLTFTYIRNFIDCFYSTNDFFSQLNPIEID